MWESRRKLILQRDNYTCQRCKTFNPSLGRVEVINKEKNTLEFHEYRYGANTYEFYCKNINDEFDNGVSFEINFGAQLVLPVMQVHHLYYTIDTELWQYDDEALQTLCKQCHTNLHLTESIPLYDKNKNYLSSTFYTVEDIGTGRIHNFEPWIFITRNNKGEEYQVADARATLKTIVFGDEKADEVEKRIQGLYHEFMQKYLPRYHRT